MSATWRDRRCAHASRGALVGVACLAALQLGACNSALLQADGSSGPDNQRLVRLAGELEARGDSETAASLYAHAAETSGGGEARLRLANAQLKSGNLAAAAEAFEKVLAETPQHPEALLGLGTVQLKRGDAVAAERTLAAACPLVNSSAAYNRWGTALMLTGRFEQAIGSFEQARALQSDDLDASGNLALAQALSGHADEAVTVMREVTGSPLAKPRHHANLVIVLAIAGKLDEARAVSVPEMSAKQRADLMARARKARDSKDPLAKARAVGLAGA